MASKKVYTYLVSLNVHTPIYLVQEYIIQSIYS